MYIVQYILRKYAHVNIEMKALTLLSTSFYAYDVLREHGSMFI